MLIWMEVLFEIYAAMCVELHIAQRVINLGDLIDDIQFCFPRQIMPDRTHLHAGSFLFQEIFSLNRIVDGIRRPSKHAWDRDFEDVSELILYQ